MSKVGGDDLDDDFVPDELVALSDPEESEATSDDDGAAFLSPDEDGQQAEETRVQEKKRKRKEKEKERKAKASGLPSSPLALERSWLTTCCLTTETQVGRRPGSHSAPHCRCPASSNVGRLSILNASKDFL